MSGIINKYYNRLYSDIYVKQPIVPKPLEVVYAAFPLHADAQEITLAQYDRHTKDVITAHKMADYRRKRFNLVLLPEVDILFDKILEGNEYWNALLHDESPYY